MIFLTLDLQDVFIYGIIEFSRYISTILLFIVLICLKRFCLSCIYLIPMLGINSKLYGCYCMQIHAYSPHRTVLLITRPTAFGLVC